MTRRLDQVSVALILTQEKSRTALAATEDKFARCYFADVDGHGDVPQGPVNRPAASKRLSTRTLAASTVSSDRSRQHSAQKTLVLAAFGTAGDTANR